MFSKYLSKLASDLLLQGDLFFTRKLLLLRNAKFLEPLQRIPIVIRLSSYYKYFSMPLEAEKFHISPMQAYLIFLAVASLGVYFYYAYDKKQAIANQWRVPEANLLLGTLASPVGAFFGMVIPHHKTRKPKFWGVLCVSIALHVLVASQIYAMPKM